MKTELNIRDKIVEEARSHIGTPHHHQGRLKHTGIDCVGIVVNCAKAIGIPVQDKTGYSSRPTGILPIELEKAGFISIPLEEKQPGDVGVFWFYKPELPQHAAIFSKIKEEWALIHTFTDVGKVIEQRIPDEWLRRLTHVFRFPGVK